MLGGGLAVAGIGLAVSGRADSVAFAAGAVGGADSPTVVVSVTALADNEVAICLVDTARQRLAVYLADGKRSRLKLLAVRDIEADWALTDYNNDPPLPKDVRARVEKWKETARPAGAAESKPGAAQAKPEAETAP